MKFIPLEIYPNWEIILADLGEIFCFEYSLISTTAKGTNLYNISDMLFASKVYLDSYIKNSLADTSEYARASVLYYLYACRYLIIHDIKYPSYEDWKNKNKGMTLDHALPRRWFPSLTFDCTNWKPMPLDDNRNKGDDFLDEGLERLDYLFSEIDNIKSKYI